jgi:hypothetical protein
MRIQQGAFFELRKADLTKIKFYTKVTALIFTTLLATSSLPKAGNRNMVDTRTCDVQDGREQVPALEKNV